MAEENKWGGTAPVFRVTSVAAAVEYYVSALGFRHNWGTGGFASVSRDGCTIFLCEGDQGHFGTWVWIGVNDASSLEAELRRELREDPPSADELHVGVRDASGGSRR